LHRDERVLVLGSTGFLGSYFLSLLGKRATAHTTRILDPKIEKNYKSMVFRKSEIDKIRVFLEKQNCGKIINCTALADIERCELNPELAYWINSELPGLLSSISLSLNSKFIHISTDAVFDGTSSFRTEFDKPSPLSVYGKSKLDGEQLVLGNNPHSMVARVNFFGHSNNKPSLFNFFHDNLVSGKIVFGYTDVYFTPLYAADLVKVILELVNQNTSGLLHVVGDERISKFDFGVMIAEIFGLPTTNLKKGKISRANGAALRSVDLSLANDKIKSLGINVPSVRDGLSILKKSMI
jgi:dTDP-4-dehydrorhamnose reductase